MTLKKWVVAFICDACHVIEEGDKRLSFFTKAGATKFQKRWNLKYYPHLICLNLDRTGHFEAHVYEANDIGPFPGIPLVKRPAAKYFK
ncbi:TPA: hypothetical protein H1016_05070 [archaeon]|uniref:Uncharacterized protein n=1 Tax=Candidatus Naiadarchaeum limnaeum TaxID=2756139 RepID=A0A832XJP2_9ARCH|nr:hypothetical protein [Candidatus Naiadarchaeum limnaeum]